MNDFYENYKKTDIIVTRKRRIKSHFPVFIIICWYFFKSMINTLKSFLHPLFQLRGYCPCCCKKTTFIASNYWYRDSLRCMKCGSLPRDRQVFKYLNEYMKGRTDFRVLEFAPLPGAYMNDRETSNYTISHYFPDEKFGKAGENFYNEDIQKTTFPDASFDIIIHEDILEHINDPFQAVKEGIRILADGGVLVFTCPVKCLNKKTIRRTAINKSGELEYLLPPQYHGNPIANEGALVFWDFGKDFEALLRKEIPNNTKLEHIASADPHMGICGEMLDMYCITKIPAESGKKT